MGGVQVPAGLGLYWFVGNCVSIIQQYFVVGWGSLRPKRGGSQPPITQPKGAGPPKNGGGPGNAKQLPRRVQGGRAKAKDANRITLLRDTNGDGIPDVRTVFLDHLNSPFGVALVGHDLYVANTDAIMRYPYQDGQTSITAKGTKLTDLPGGPIDHHWTKSLLASPDGSKLWSAAIWSCPISPKRSSLR